ncbi:MAG: hypothetical protein Q8Q85_13545 [Gemmatimonadales bacterium]|nr:hypothetical protein [Gemmatimonadales bacterium]
MRRARLIGVVALALAVSARPGRAQDPRLAGRLDAGTRAAVEAIVDSVRALGVPTDPLIAKALEGASKNAPGARILAAVRRLSGELAAARGALGAASSTAELVAGAAALRAGAPVTALQRVRAVRTDETVAVHLAVLADLLADGVPPDTASLAVVALARAALRDAELVAFRQSVDRDIALGAPPGAAVAVRVNATARDQVLGAGASSPGPARPRRP